MQRGELIFGGQQVLKCAIRQADQSEAGAQVSRQVAHVALGDRDATPDLLGKVRPTLPGLGDHVGGQLEAGDVDAGCGHGEQGTSRATAGFENRAAAG